MSDSKTPTRYSGADRRAAAGKVGAGVVSEPYKPGGRHAAITNHLYNFHSYKNWADKVKGSWDDKK